jgi:hypothetical protein
MSERIDSRARRLVDLKDEKNRLEKDAERAARAYSEEEQAFWMELSDELGDIKTVTLDLGEGYGTVQLQRRETITARIVDKEAAVESLEAAGLGQGMLGVPEIRKRALNEEVRDRLQRGEALPDGVDFNARRYITVTRKGD